MKRFKGIFKVALLSIAFMLPTEGWAQTDGMDSVDVSLLTCGSGNEVYTAFGHTAIRVNDRRQGGRDMAFNYGIFSFKEKFFVLRFIFGLTDYELACYPTDAFCEGYRREGRMVVEQVLNLTNGEKQRLVTALLVNCLPENKTYRYNFFYDNCTTRARDIILKNIDGDVDFKWKGNRTTYREMVHEWNGGMPWYRFGEDLLLGLMADVDINEKQQQFSPIKMENDMIDASITNSKGEKRNLVKCSNKLTTSSFVSNSKSFPLTPLEVSVWVLLIVSILTFVEWKRKKVFWMLDVLLFLAAGLSGIIIFAMIFSQHPTVSLNLNILFLNPIPLFLIPVTIKRGWKKLYNPAFKYILIVLLVFVVIAPIFQRIPLALIVLALSLLVRCVSQVFLRQRLQAV